MDDERVDDEQQVPPRWSDGQSVFEQARRRNPDALPRKDDTNVPVSLEDADEELPTDDDDPLGDESPR